MGLPHPHLAHSRPCLMFLPQDPLFFLLTVLHSLGWLQHYVANANLEFLICLPPLPSLVSHHTELLLLLPVRISLCSSGLL